MFGLLSIKISRENQKMLQNFEIVFYITMGDRIEMNSSSPMNGTAASRKKYHQTSNCLLWFGSKFRSLHGIVVKIKHKAVKIQTFRSVISKSLKPH